MAVEWKKVSLGEVILFSNGKSRPSSQGTVPIYGGNGILGFCDKGNAEDVIIVGRVGIYCGSVNYEPNVCWISDNAIQAKNRPNIDLRFAYYLLSLLGLNKYSIGAAQPLLTQKILNDIEVYIPIDTAEQRRIAEILSAFDDKIELNLSMCKTLEAMAQALFKSWFVDFDPVKAKMEARANGGNDEAVRLAAMTVISGKSAEELVAFQSSNSEAYAELAATADLFPETLTDSELGPIPEGWEMKTFGELLSFTIGGDWGEEEADNKHTEQVKIIRGTDIPKVYAGDDKTVPIRFVEKKKLATRNLQAGDIVIEVSGGSKDQPTGRSLFITSNIIKRFSIPLEPASFCRLFRPINYSTGIILGLHLQRIYQEGKTWLYQNQSTGISNFQTKTFLENEYLAFPSNDVLILFSGKIDPIISQISSDKNINLENIRDTLLPKLLSGEIDLASFREEQ